MLMLLFFCFALASMEAAASPKIGSPFPKVTDFSLEGTLPELKGKIVLVDFWASWCLPCKKSFPVLNELQEKFARRGFVVLAVSVDEDRAAMEAFLKKTPSKFAVVRDGKGRLAEAAGVEKMPTSFILGADGRVIAQHSGFEGEATRKAYLAEIEAALKSAGP